MDQVPSPGSWSVKVLRPCHRETLGHLSLDKESGLGPKLGTSPGAPGPCPLLSHWENLSQTSCWNLLGMEVALILRPRGSLEGLVWAPCTGLGKGRTRPGRVAPPPVPSCTQMLARRRGGGVEVAVGTPSGSWPGGKSVPLPLAELSPHPQGGVSRRPALGSPPAHPAARLLLGCPTPAGPLGLSLPCLGGLAGIWSLGSCRQREFCLLRKRCWPVWKCQAGGAAGTAPTRHLPPDDVGPRAVATVMEPALLPSVGGLTGGSWAAQGRAVEASLQGLSWPSLQPSWAGGCGRMMVHLGRWGV